MSPWNPLITIFISAATFSQNIRSKLRRNEAIPVPPKNSNSYVKKCRNSSTSLHFRDDPFGLGINIDEDLGYTNAAMESLGLSMSGKLDLDQLLQSALDSLKNKKGIIEVGTTLINKDLDEIPSLKNGKPDQVMEVGGSLALLKKDYKFPDYAVKRSSKLETFDFTQNTFRGQPEQVKGSIYLMEKDCNSPDYNLKRSSKLDSTVIKNYTFPYYAVKKESKLNKVDSKQNELNQPKLAARATSIASKNYFFADYSENSNLSASDFAPNELKRPKEVRGAKSVNSKNFFFADYSVKIVSRIDKFDSVIENKQDQAVGSSGSLVQLNNKLLHNVYNTDGDKLEKNQKQDPVAAAVNTNRLFTVEKPFFFAQKPARKRLKVKAVTNNSKNSRRSKLRNLFFVDSDSKIDLKSETVDLQYKTPEQDINMFKALSSVSVSRSETSSDEIESLDFDKTEQDKEERVSSSLVSVSISDTNPEKLDALEEEREQNTQEQISSASVKNYTSCDDSMVREEMSVLGAIITPGNYETNSLQTEIVNERKKNMVSRELEMQKMASRKRIKDILVEQEREATKRAEASRLEEEKRQQEVVREAERQRIESMKKEIERVAAERERKRKDDLEKMKLLSESAIRDTEKEIQNIIAEAKKERKLLVEAKREMNNLLANTVSLDEVKLDRERRKIEFDQLFPLKQKEKTYNHTLSVASNSTEEEIDIVRDTVVSNRIDTLVSAVQPTIKSSRDSSADNFTLDILEKNKTFTSNTDGKLLNESKMATPSPASHAKGIKKNKPAFEKLLDKVSSIENEMEQQIDAFISRTSDAISLKFSSFASDQLISKPQIVNEMLNSIDPKAKFLNFPESEISNSIPNAAPPSSMSSIITQYKIDNARYRKDNDLQIQSKKEVINKKIDELKRKKKLNEEKLFAHTKVLEEKLRRQSEKQKGIRNAIEKGGVDAISNDEQITEQKSFHNTQRLNCEATAPERIISQSIEVDSEIVPKGTASLIENSKVFVMEQPDTRIQSLGDGVEKNQYLGVIVSEPTKLPLSIRSSLFSFSHDENILQGRITLHKLSSMSTETDFGLTIQQINILQKAKKSSTVVSLKMLAYLITCARKSASFLTELNKAYDVKKQILIAKYKDSENVNDRTLSYLLYLGLLDVHKSPQSQKSHRLEFASLNYVASSILLLILLSLFEAGKNMTVGERMATFATVVRISAYSPAKSCMRKSSLFVPKT